MAGRKAVENRGGAGRGQGRKPLPDGEAAQVVSIRLTRAQKDKLEKLGGAAWVREKISRAKVPE